MESSSVKWVTAGVLTLALAVPMTAQSRGGERRGGGHEHDRGRAEDSRRDDDRSSRNDDRSYRDNDRVRVQGRVTSFSQERDGYRVQLDRGRESYWVPQSYFRNRDRNRGLRVGVSIILGGVFRGGSVYVDDVNWPDDGYSAGRYGGDSVRGYVERVDRRRGAMDVRDDRTGRMITIVFRNSDRYGRLGFEDVRRGDEIEVSGAWSRGGVFEAYDIEGIREGGRY